jgi:hypothetical protein
VRVLGFASGKQSESADRGRENPSAAFLRTTEGTEKNR